MTNVAIPPSGTGDAGKSVATETIGGVEYQLVKLITGTAASTTPLTTFPVSGPLTDTQLRATAVPVSGTVTVDTSTLSTSALQTTGNTLTGIVTETAPATDTASSGLNGRLQRIAQRLTSLIAVFTIGAGTEAAAVRVTLPTDGTGKVSAAQSGTWNVGTVSTVTAVTAISNALPAGTNTIGAVTGAGSATASTAGSQVASSASSVTLLSSNSARKGMLFYNGSTSSANVLFGTTASATSFTIYMAPGSTYEMFGMNLYTGRVDAIWVTANGNMQVTEW